MKTLNVGCGNILKGTHFIDKFPSSPKVLKCDMDFDSIPFDDDFFDVVIMNNVFEHIRNHAHALSEVYRVLKPKGRVELITDNAGYFLFHAGSGHTHYGGYESEHAGDNHYCLFTVNHLKNHLKKSGFEDIKWCFFNDFNNLSKFNNFILWFLRVIGKKHMAYPKFKFIGCKLNE